MKPFYTNFWLRGKTLFVKWIDGNGIRQVSRYPIEPSLYIKSPDKKPTPFTDIFGNPVHEVNFSSPKEARDFAKSYEDTPGFPIFGFPRFAYAKINELFPGTMEFSIKHINIGWIDIETEIGETFATPDNPHQRINAISLHYAGKMVTLSLYDVEGTIYCKTETELLEKFLIHWKIADLDVISGWNTQGFDLPYIANRINLVLGDDRADELSPFGAIQFQEVDTKWGSTQQQVEIHGIASLDLLELYRKFVLQKQESYRLDFIAQKDLGVGKLEYEGSLKDLYENDVVKFIEYNQVDVIRTMQINEKRSLIETAIGIAYTAKCHYKDSLTTITLWDVIIANHLSEQNIQVPFESGGSKSSKFEGAFVKDPIVGYHEWLMSFDLGSLYPSLKIAYNISPEKIVPMAECVSIRPSDIANNTELYKKAKAKADSLNATLCANGAMFYRDSQGFVPLLLEQMLERRKTAKVAMKNWKKEAERARGELKQRRSA